METGDTPKPNEPGVNGLQRNIKRICFSHVIILQSHDHVDFQCGSVYSAKDFSNVESEKLYSLICAGPAKRYNLSEIKKYCNQSEQHKVLGLTL